MTTYEISNRTSGNVDAERRLRLLAREILAIRARGDHDAADRATRLTRAEIKRARAVDDQARDHAAEAERDVLRAQVGAALCAVIDEWTASAAGAAREEAAEVLGKNVAEVDADLDVARVIDPDAQCREHGCAAHACTESH